MKKCGLLGRRLGHSYSPAIHAMLADYEYKLYECEPEGLGHFLSSGGFDGLNVTIPYKKSVMPYCARLSPTAAAIGSVNTIVRLPDGSLYGDNTDAFGFESMLSCAGIDPRGKKCLVLGSGGASVTAQAVLKRLAAGSVTVISRSGADNYTNLHRHADADIIVNTTPLGMYPDNGTAPLDLRLFPKCSGVADVVYNPARTALLLQAEELGIPNIGGLHMLVAQAKRAAELFTGGSIDDGIIAAVEKKLSADMQNIVLIGMPGCGKSTVAQALAEITGRQLYDSDEIIARRGGMSIPEIFAKYGEGDFRRRETQVLGELGKMSGAIISTGGGCVTRTENYPLLHQNGVIVLIGRDIAALDKEGRPISQSGDLNELYRIRRPMYERFCDLRVDNNGPLSDTLRQIMEVIQ